MFYYQFTWGFSSKICWWFTLQQFRCNWIHILFYIFYHFLIIYHQTCILSPNLSFSPLSLIWLLVLLLTSGSNLPSALETHYVLPMLLVSKLATIDLMRLNVRLVLYLSLDTLMDLPVYTEQGKLLLCHVWLFSLLVLQIQCGNLFENSVVDEFNECAVSRKKCVPKKSDVGEFPVPDPAVLVKNFNIADFNGKWFITSGLNPTFDTFNCQLHEFHTESKKLVGNLSWRIGTPDGGFFTRSAVQRFVQDPTQPGILYNHDNEYLHYQDDWYFLYFFLQPLSCPSSFIHLGICLHEYVLHVCYQILSLVENFY